VWEAAGIASGKVAGAAGGVNAGGREWVAREEVCMVRSNGWTIRLFSLNLCHALLPHPMTDDHELLRYYRELFQKTGYRTDRERSSIAREVQVI
jgi:hypothetical protein